MPTVTLITPVGRPLSDHHRTLARSVARQRSLLPPGWDLQWCLHFDGVDPAPTLSDPAFGEVADCLVVSSSPARTGPARARNRALAAATGELAASLDDDDELGPSWFRLVEHLAARPQLGWVAGRCDDVDDDGRVTHVDVGGPLPYGSCVAGTAAQSWLDGDPWQFSCCAVVARTALLRAVGGWAALGWCEDVAAWAAVTELADGWLLDEVVYLWRKHPSRITHSGQRDEHLAASLDSVRQRILALRALGLAARRL